MQKKLKKHFIPHKDNDFSPHALQQAAVTGMLGLILLSYAIANLQSLLWVTSEWMVSTILPAVVVTETNNERTAESLTPLFRNEVLDAAATKKAEDMASKEYFAHYSPEGVSPWFWFKEVAYDYVHAGENLAVHFTDSSEVVKAWMQSPTHRANIMNGVYQEIGIGTAKGTYQGYPTVFVVQLFGTEAAPVVPLTEAVSPNVPTSEAVSLVATEIPDVPGAVLAASEAVIQASDIQTEEVMPQHLEEVTVVEDDHVVVFSNHIATSVAGVPATLKSEVTEVSTPPALGVLTQPQKVLQFLYMIIGIFVALTLALSIVIEIRRQNPIQIMYGTGLIVAMALLFHIHISISSGALIL